MRFEVAFSPEMREKYPIEGFCDAILDELEVQQYHVSVSFLDHRRNSAVILATGEFGEFIKEKFQHNKFISIKFPENYHNPFHVKYLDKDDTMRCGCGWVESPAEHTKRLIAMTPNIPMLSSSIQFQIVSRRDIPK